MIKLGEINYFVALTLVLKRNEEEVAVDSKSDLFEIPNAFCFIL